MIFLSLQVKVAYVRNLTPNVSEEQLKEEFSTFGAVERVKKLKDYAFIHFTEREHCLKAVEEMNNKVLDDVSIEVSLAKPRPANKERRFGQSGFGALSTRGRGGMRGVPRGRGGFHQGYDRGYGGDYGNYGDGYDGGYGGGYGDGYGDGYYDNHYGSGYGGYDNYGGGRVGHGMSPRGRPRGAPGRGGPPRGGRGGPRGRGAPGGRGRGYPRGAGGPTTPAKRKYGPDNPQALVGYPEPKRRFSAPEQQNQQWGSQPIAQQPLAHDAGYSDGNQSEWYQDNYYGQQPW